MGELKDLLGQSGELAIAPLSSPNSIIGKGERNWFSWKRRNQAAAPVSMFLLRSADGTIGTGPVPGNKKGEVNHIRCIVLACERDMEDRGGKRIAPVLGLMHSVWLVRQHGLGQTAKLVCSVYLTSQLFTIYMGFADPKLDESTESISHCMPLLESFYHAESAYSRGTGVGKVFFSTMERTDFYFRFAKQMHVFFAGLHVPDASSGLYSCDGCCECGLG